MGYIGTIFDSLYHQATNYVLVISFLAYFSLRKCIYLCINESTVVLVSTQAHIIVLLY